MMHRNKSVDAHQFAMVPRADIPRSSVRRQAARKLTFFSGFLVPVYCEEVYPGDAVKLSMQAFTRLSTPLKPIMDNLHFESFFFYVPNRLLWTNWVRMMGEQDNPADSISFTVPQIVSPVNGFPGPPSFTLYDMFAIPCAGQTAVGNTISISALPFRAYNQIFNAWFRDENLINSAAKNVGDGPDAYTDYALLRRGKRHDYFTSCLPWPQKGNTSVTLPLGTSATVRTSASQLVTGANANPLTLRGTTAGGLPGVSNVLNLSGAGNVFWSTTASGAFTDNVYPSNLYADLTTATAATINSIRLAFQTQKLLERDARGGTRYTEIVRSHFGTVSPDARLQRPEYLGGGHTPIIVNPIAQTTPTPAAGTTTPQGNLAAMGTGLASGHGFTQSFTEHGWIIGLINVRADLTYQQGIRRQLSRKTRYDYYWPVFAALGEQTVLNQEIYSDGSANDALTFGWQERWGELRYQPSEICGLFRSTATGTIDFWHLSQKFTALPTLNATFISDTPPLARILAVPTEPEFLCDIFFDSVWARQLPMYSVPGQIDHF